MHFSVSSDGIPSLKWSSFGRHLETERESHIHRKTKELKAKALIISFFFTVLSLVYKKVIK